MTSPVPVAPDSSRNASPRPGSRAPSTLKPQSVISSIRFTSISVDVMGCCGPDVVSVVEVTAVDGSDRERHSISIRMLSPASAILMRGSRRMSRRCGRVSGVGEYLVEGRSELLRAMGKRWGSSWLLLLLLLLGVLLVSMFQCCQALEGGVHSSELVGVEEDDDLEDLEEGMDANAGDALISSQDAMAAAKVANVNDQDVQRVVAKFDYVLLLGYAPWCTQSQALLREFAAAAAQLSQLGNPTVLAKLDAVNNPSAALRYEIHGFPTLVFFVHGAREDYFGGYSRDEIVLWVRKKTGFAVTTIQSKDEAECFLRKKVPAVLGYFEKLEGPEHDAFISAAKTEADTEFVLTTVPEVAQMFINPPLIAVSKQEPERFSAFGGKFDAMEITSFVDLNKQPLLTVLNSKNAIAVYSSPLKLHIMLFSERKDYERVKPLYLEAAKDFKGKVMFLVIDLEDEDFSKPLLAAYGLDTSKPVVAALNNENGSRYHLESYLTYENLKEFAAELYAGNLTVYFKSEPIPAENEGLVKIVVGKNLEEIVMDDTKDVFLYVHAPWCVSCEKVHGRVFEKLAKHVKEVPSLIMAKYDAQANEHPLLLEVPHYPSLLLYPAGRKSNEPIFAKADASWKKLLVFLKKNVAIPFPVSKDHAPLNAESNGQKEAGGVDISSIEQVYEIDSAPSPEELHTALKAESNGQEEVENVDICNIEEVTEINSIPSPEDLHAALNAESNGQEEKADVDIPNTEQGSKIAGTPSPEELHTTECNGSEEVADVDIPNIQQVDEIDGIPSPEELHAALNAVSCGQEEVADVDICNIEVVNEIDNTPSPEELVDEASESCQSSTRGMV